MFTINGTAPLRGAATPDKHFGFYDAIVDGGWTVPGEPYKSRRTDDASGKFGRYLMDTVGAQLQGQIPALESLPAWNDEGAGTAMHLYTPW